MNGSAPPVLCINPGSTSTRVAVFAGEAPLLQAEISHSRPELAACGGVQGQLEFRRAAIEKALAPLWEAGRLPRFAAVAGRGGLLRPLPGGVYAVGPAMLAELAAARHGEHACNLGAPLALAFAQAAGCPAFVVDPPVTDELRDQARVTGLPRLRRRSLLHALSQRAAARRAAEGLGLRYEDTKFVVAHLGGGASVGAHQRGRIVDATNALDGEGPMSAERAGTLPGVALLDLVLAGEDPAALRRELLCGAGLYGHAGTNDLREVEARAAGGDARCEALLEALAYSVAKAVGQMAATLFEDDGAPVAAVVLTGGMAGSARLVEGVRRRTAWLAPLVALPEVEEMRALALGALRALAGLETVRDYA